MDDQEDASKQRGIIALIDADEDVTLEEVDAAKDAKVEKNADVRGRLEESQAQVYHIDLEHADKVLITAAAATITTAPITAAPSAAKRRKGVVIRDPEETASPSTIVHSELKSKDKGKGILEDASKQRGIIALIDADEDVTLEEVDAAKDAKVEKNADVRGRLEESQAQVYHIDLEHADKVLSMQDDKAEPAELKEDDVIEQVKRKEKQDNAVLRYQALKRKPQTEAHARKNMMVYMKNMAGFKMDFFKVFSKSKEGHEDHLRTVLQTLRQEKLYAKFSKCEFWLSSVAFLGHIVSAEGIMMDPAKVEAITKWPRPTSATEKSGMIAGIKVEEEIIRDLERLDIELYVRGHHGYWASLRVEPDLIS
nr:putative reverse transcriptase domain-containing protein [Tanacetum cinerariifolium]